MNQWNVQIAPIFLFLRLFQRLAKSAFWVKVLRPQTNILYLIKREKQQKKRFRNGKKDLKDENLIRTVCNWFLKCSCRCNIKWNCWKTLKLLNDISVLRVFILFVYGGKWLKITCNVLFWLVNLWKVKISNFLIEIKPLSYANVYFVSILLRNFDTRGRTAKNSRHWDSSCQ